MKIKMQKLIWAATVAVAAVWTSQQTANATQYDLVNNSSQTVGGINGNDAIFEKAFNRPTGTGVFDPFLRVQENNEEKGFNTSNIDNPPNWDAKNGIWTHDLLFGSLQSVNKGGIDYYQFMLDLGEPSGNGKENILLKTFNLYTSGVASRTQGNNPVTGINDNPDNLGTEHFAFSAGNSIMFVDESSGNGQSDVAIYIPTSAFVNPAAYLYLYVEFGLSDNNVDGNSDGTFEEFAARTSTVPDGGTTLMLFGCALSCLGVVRRVSKR